MTFGRIDVDALQAALDPKERHCDSHGAYMAKGVLLKTKTPREVWTVCPGCVADSKAREEHETLTRAADARAASLSAMLGDTALPERFIDASFDGYKVEGDDQARARSMVQDFSQNFDRHLRLGTSMVLSGRIGTGKTHLAAAVLRAQLPRHVGVYVTMMSMLRAVRDTWDKSNPKTESEVIERLARAPLLVIDEVGVQYGSTGELTILTEIMDLRYRYVRPSILITNEDGKGFRTYVGDRVYDRATQGGIWVKFDWPSFRKRAGRQAEEAL